MKDEKLNNLDYLSKDHMNFPGAAVVRRLKKKITVNDICICGFCELKIDPKT